MLSLCDKLKEGDVDENIHHLKYKIESLTNSAIEQLKENRATNEMLLEDLKRLQSSSILPQLGPEEGAMGIKTEPASPSIEYQHQLETPTNLTGVSISVSVL